jgi:hypothetical protein
VQRRSDRAIYSAGVTFIVSLLVLMAGYECSALHGSALPFACPLTDAMGSPAAELSAQNAGALFWVAALFCACCVGYGFAYFAYPSATSPVVFGAVPYLLVIAVGIRGMLWGPPEASHAWVLGYIVLLGAHLVSSFLGARASRRAES